MILWLCVSVVVLWSSGACAGPAAAGNDSSTGCTVELRCGECVPEHMPLVTSHGAREGSVRVPAGEHVTLACPGGRFLQYPLLGVVEAACEGGRYRVQHDHALRHLLELGCQEGIFEDVMHEVSGCGGGGLQGRVYRRAGVGGRGEVLHLAALCYDTDAGVTVRAHASNAPHNALVMPPHRDDALAPLSLLGNFNHMFDASTRRAAELLYSDDARVNRRLHELLKHDQFTFAGQTLTSAELLSGLYFEDQNVRVTDFASNRVSAWSSVTGGNLRHVQRDVAELLGRAAAAGVEMHVWSGAHGVLAVRAGEGHRELRLRPGRFPVPRYLWTLVVDARSRRGMVVVVLNDPFVSVSEIRERVFCESACSGVRWLRHVLRDRRYETPVYGLTFCCHVHDVADELGLPDALRSDVRAGPTGMLDEGY